jgi:uncharacterized protein (TIGR02271 family)
VKPDANTDAEREVVRIAHERMRVDKRMVETGRVTVRTTVQEQEAWVKQELAREDVQVERVPIDREVDVIPQVRTEGDTLIVPIFEEVLVVEKRLVLREEIHLRRKMKLTQFEKPFTVRRTVAHVEREGGAGTSTPDPEQRQ